MNKKVILLLFSLIVPFFLTGCTSNIEQNQLQFGIQAAQKNLWDEAIFRWKKIIKSDPKSAAAHNNLAVAYEQKGLWEEAKKEYEIAINLKPNDEYIKANYNKFKKAYENQDEGKDEKK